MESRPSATSLKIWLRNTAFPHLNEPRMTKQSFSHPFFSQFNVKLKLMNNEKLHPSLTKLLTKF